MCAGELYESKLTAKAFKGRDGKDTVPEIRVDGERVAVDLLTANFVPHAGEGEWLGLRKNKNK